jgi:hypothetical protein
MVIPFAKLPRAIRGVARALPSGALADVLHCMLGDAVTKGTSHAGTSWAVLAAWAVAAPAIAAATFRWD